MKPREFWIEVEKNRSGYEYIDVHPYGPTKKLPNTELIHVQEVSKDNASKQCEIHNHVLHKLQKKEKHLYKMLDLYRTILVKALPALVWFYEGPYGSSPDEDALKTIRMIMNKIETMEKDIE